jgi:hypothetical protein
MSTKPRSKPKGNYDFAALDQRLVNLGILSAELAAVIGREAALIDKWREGRAQPDPEALILLRLFTDPAREHAAQLAVERVRHNWTGNLAGDGVARAGIDPPGHGGGHQGTTGGRPK